MTILAQINDCHSCYDARSIVQKRRYLGCSSVPGQELDSCMVVGFSFLVGAFVAFLVAVLVFAFV